MRRSESQDILFEVRGIVKDFPGQRALDHVDFDVRRGEVHALIGENGAGKSTLIKIIAGFYSADDGEIFIGGKRVKISNPGESQHLGLAFIHQDLNIVPHLSVAENIFLGRYPESRSGIVRLSKMVEMAKNIPAAVPINADFRTPAGMLGIIDQWKIVINRALALQSNVIFMDEPTSSLTHNEVNQLFQSILHLKKIGKAVVYVSHRMEEVFRLADRVTVIKDAKKVGTVAGLLADSKTIYEMMIGRDFKDAFPPKGNPQNKVCLEVNNISRGSAVRRVSFHLHAGEILGIAGLVGSGRTELARLLFGADRKDSGTIFINGEKADIRSPTQAIQCGIALVPEERRSEGLVLPMDVKQNITLASLSKFLRWMRIPVMSRKKEKALAWFHFESTGIKASGLGQRVESLSGGNQQKVVLSKWLCSGAKILILDDPTKGIDVGARFALYRLITDLARNGAGIIMISSDLAEVVGLSHRILLMKQGVIKTQLLSHETDLPSLLQLCLEGEKKPDSPEVE